MSCWAASALTISRPIVPVAPITMIRIWRSPADYTDRRRISADSVALALGTRLGAYEILSLLGIGGMGEVYRGRDVRLERDVAIKILPSDVAADPDRLARFEREAHALAALNHPHIVMIFSIEHINDIRFITMELVEGRSLDKLIASEGVSCPEF